MHLNFDLLGIVGSIETGNAGLFQCLLLVFNLLVEVQYELHVGFFKIFRVFYLHQCKNVIKLLGILNR